MKPKREIREVQPKYTSKPERYKKGCCLCAKPKNWT